MKALTICQPYAELIMRGEKPIENRTWPTSYRGWLVIHAGKSREWLGDGDEQRYPDMAFGAVVGAARLVACLQLSQAANWPEPYRSLAENEHAHGPWCWVLETAARRHPPLPWRGAQGLWTVESDLSTAIRLPVAREAQASGSDSMVSDGEAQK